MNTPAQTKNGTASREVLWIAEDTRCARIMALTSGFRKK